ncbi:Peptidoglycan glycosyltransferase [uncultured Paludibacter sp.]|uniref:Peptidoglycan glycosyltransferase n=1 Tax=uncultured Paludibacter sp. TaxID=497635 RepID=A0A653AG59_9BACT|nr:Peptidoglycan glycosyltransferase [uncultured Paludibacter sp.]
MINDKLQNRRFVITVIITVVVIIYILRLFSLQILDSKYKAGADSNAFLKKTIFPPRGLIYDRNDSLLVFNKPAYDIAFINREIKNLDTVSFCRDLRISTDFFKQQMAEVKDRKKNPGYSSYSPQVFLTQLSTEDVATIQQSMYKYPGFYIQNRTLREYKYHVAAHVLGSVGEVSRKTIENDDYYRQGDFAGRNGIEYTYEKDLRGEKGMEILLRDAKGRIKGKYEEGKKDIAAKAGKNLRLTLDVNLQKLGEELMGDKIGSVVAIEPKTGEILAMVTNPTFDPALLVGRERSKNYLNLLNDSRKPLINRATQAQYSPGSSIKPFQALIALDMGGITEKTIFGCSGPASYPVKCTHYHGSPVTLLSAIEESCNPYFWNAFRTTLEQKGYGEKNIYFKNEFAKWREEIMSFGFGKKLEDSDLYQQVNGNIPSINFYDKIYGVSGWKAMTIRSLSIGQGEILITPVQLANAVCAIANKGYYITAHLNKSDSLLRHKHTPMPNKNFYNIVDQGMWRVIEYGTARVAKIPGVSWCGKTGTVQNSRGKDHAFFIGYAPRENPKIAIAVTIENVGFGATYAAPIAKLMVEQYLNKKLSQSDDLGKIKNLKQKSNAAQ